jgi:hypothetical protein
MTTTPLFDIHILEFTRKIDERPAATRSTLEIMAFAREVRDAKPAVIDLALYRLALGIDFAREWEWT